MWGRRHRGWDRAEDLLRRYVLEVDTFWSGAMARQAGKLQRQLASLERQHGWDPSEVVERLVELARARRPDPPPGVYVTGLGSSGSHWLAAMLAELDGFVDVGEVYFSAELRAELDALDEREHRLMVADAIQLLHGMSGRVDLGDATTVNSAAGAYELELYRSWDARAVVVYLHRDPRDQVLSAAFRKDEYRRYTAPDADDTEYVLQMCRRNRADHARYRDADGHADHEVAYEQLRRDAVPVVGAIARSAGRDPSDAQVAEAVRRHDAAAIRAGDVEDQGNLDLGGRARGWQQDADRELRALLHVELAETITSLGYPLVECLPEGDDLAAPVRHDDPGGSGVVLCAAGDTTVDDSAVTTLLGTAPIVLDLSRTAVTDAVVDDLLGCPSLQAVGLQGTQVSERGIVRLRDARSELVVRSRLAHGTEAP